MIRRALWSGLFGPLLAMTLALVPAGDGQAAKWGMAQHDAQHTGKGTAAGPFAALLKWSLQHPNVGWDPSFRAGTAIGDDGTIYAVGGDGRAYALRPDGTVKYAFDNIGVCCSSPAIGPDGTIYFSGDKLYALNPDFTLKWVYQNGGACCGALVIGPDGTIYVVNGALHAVNPMDGTARWVFQSPDSAYLPAAPALSPDGSTVYVATDKTLYALNPADAQAKWQSAIGNIAETAPVVGTDGTIFIPSASSILALNPHGMPVRQIPVPAGKQVTAMAFDSGPQGETLVCTVFAYSINPDYYFPTWAADGELYAIDPHAWTSEGAVRWTSPFAGGGGLTSTPDSRPIIDARGAIYLAALVFSAPWTEVGVHLYGFSATGSQLFDYYASTTLHSDTRVLSMANTGVIYLLADGAVKAFSPPADSTPPTTYSGVSGCLGNNGWYTCDVAVSLWPTDNPVIMPDPSNPGGSGVAKTEYSFDGVNWYSYYTPVTVSTEGSSAFFYRSTDNAGNVEPAKYQSINIDKAAPYTYPILNGTKGLNCWYKGSVAATITASDYLPGSGLDRIEYSLDGTVWSTYTAPVAFNADGTYTLSHRAVDKAGNVESTKSTTFKIDTIPPAVTPPADITVEATGVQTAVTIGTATATDNMGAVSPNSDAPATFPVGTTLVTWTAKDAVGNTGTATQKVTVKDTTPPVITPPPNKTVEATGPLTLVSIGLATATDMVGPATTSNNAPASFPIGTTKVIWSAVDGAGNGKSAEQLITVIDTTPPVLTAPVNITVLLGTPMSAAAVQAFVNGARAADVVDQNVTITWSGPTDLNGVGTKAVTFTAGDRYGNTSTATAHIYVKYAFGGFLAPVSLSKPFKLGSTVPVKFQLADVNGTTVTSATARFYLQQYSNNEPVGDPIEVTSPGEADSGNYFRLADGAYLYNLSTRNLATGRYQIQVVLEDGTTNTTWLELKQ